MIRTLSLAVILAVSAAASVAAPPAQKKEGIESKGYVWNAQEGEKIEALKLKGNAKQGEEDYEVCGGCHLPSGAGRPDGTFPQLAGQHASVLIKQMADIRGGLRDNPTMYPFAKELTDPQALANVAAYLKTLCVPSDNGKGDGKNQAHGKALYEKDCKTCHGANGQGDAQKFFPVLAGQHYKYMLRQGMEIRDGKRRNANPDMVKVIKTYSTADIEAITDYMSRLTMPGTQCKPAGKKK